MVQVSVREAQASRRSLRPGPQGTPAKHALRCA